jgi:pimeloyl-ACP methyl ester carboxylesterase
MTPHERVFFTGLGTAMAGARGIAHSRTAMHASKIAAEAMNLDATGIEEWALREFRSTSPWAVARAVSELGRHHSRPWLGRIDVPTAVVVLRNDHVIPPQRQVALARSIPGATMHDIDAGHAACVLESEVFVPALVEAASTVNARRRDLKRARGA